MNKFNPLSFVKFLSIKLITLMDLSNKTIITPIGEFDNINEAIEKHKISQMRGLRQIKVGKWRLKDNDGNETTIKSKTKTRRKTTKTKTIVKSDSVKSDLCAENEEEKE